MNKLIQYFAIGFLSLATASAVAGCGDGRETAEHSHADASAHGEAADGHAHGHDGADAHGTGSARLIFSSQPQELPAGAPATWTLRIVDSTDKPVEKFALVHEKLLHLIVVSADLSWFNHVHPEYKGNGEFSVTMTLPREGGYKLYADYTPEGRSQVVSQQEIRAGGSATPAATPLPVADTLGPGGWMVKRVHAIPEGEPDFQGGAEYQVALMPMPGSIVAGRDVMLHFQVRDRSGKPIDNLEPYLGAMGHAVILSSDTKTYLHTHPMEDGMQGMDHGAMNHGKPGADSAMAGAHAAPKSGGSDVMFHTNFPAAGRYKAWGQFQHNGKIVMAAFVLDVRPS